MSKRQRGWGGRLCGLGGGAALAALTALACNTLDTRFDGGYEGPRTYSGTRKALRLAGEAFFRLNPPEFGLWAGDAALCSVVDTLILPLTIPEQLRQSREQTEHLRTDVDQPSLLREIKGEKPLSTAKRLFRECSGRLININPDVTDCYSISAKIQIEGKGKGGAEELTGAEYKRRLREELLPLAGTGRFIKVKDPTYQEQLPNVEIVARLTNDTSELPPLVWVVGPGPDGGWRILEERGPGFP